MTNTDMEDGLNEFWKRLDSLETSQKLLAKENKSLKEKVPYLDNYTRQQNICIVEIPEKYRGPTTVVIHSQTLIGKQF